ncbi:MAG: nicotinate-nucleotide--dimethylbenzimidazole phosphoribosyltransferase, partial [Verrucomicrobiota bacterium]
MTMEECHQAIGNGSKIVRSLPGNSLLLGEMGIGNTSSASLLMARLTGESIDVCTGAGTGLDDEGVQKKISVLRRILERVPQVKEPLEVLATFGGFEIATMVGAVLQAAQERRVIVVDGFITTSAVLVAELMYPSVVERCVFSHQSQEKAHGKLLEFLKTKALLDLQLRLGEGSGAALVWPLLESACRILNEMASFQSAGVSEKAKN